MQNHTKSFYEPFLADFQIGRRVLFSHAQSHIYKYSYIYTYIQTGGSLTSQVWGSLRLAPIIWPLFMYCDNLYFHVNTRMHLFFIIQHYYFEYFLELRILCTDYVEFETEETLSQKKQGRGI